MGPAGQREQGRASGACALRACLSGLTVGPGGQRGEAGERARGVGAGRGVRAGRESREEWARRAGPCGWIGPE